MSEKKKSSLENIGYLIKLPKDSDINDYESILMTDKDGEKIRLYRLSSEKKEFDDTNNFSNSWDIFNSYLN